MKRLIALIAVIWLLILPVSAETDDPYTNEYELSGAGELENALPEDTRQWMAENGLDPSDSNWVNKLTAKGVFGHLWDFVTGGASAPLKAGAAIIGIILISAAFPVIATDGKSFEPACQAAAVATALTVAFPVWETVTAAVGAIKGCGTFMLSFIPVFAVIVSVSGAAVTAASMSALLLAAAELVASAASFAVLPMMGSYLAMSLCSSVSPLIAGSGIAESIRKAAFWVLSLVSTLFVGILSIQTAVNSAADSLALKTTRFIIGTSVPVAGSALSEAVSTVTASLGLLRSSVGIYGVVALAAILLPLLIETLMWRLVLAVGSITSELFGQGTITKILKAIDTMLSVLVGVMLLVGAMFIISLTVIVGMGKGL